MSHACAHIFGFPRRNAAGFGRPAADVEADLNPNVTPGQWWGKWVKYGIAHGQQSWELASQNHRFEFELEGTFKGHPVQLPCNEQGHLQLDLAPAVGRGAGGTVSNAVPRMCASDLTVPNLLQISQFASSGFNL